ncbi:sporulation integral membrane protein YlbJ [Natroniella sulfidigena]|uniref:sporulation integral membrane protein YlbJ n=1 Tax=Natroniella sulfidigena TaxID=723921 RepID=UPI00200ADA5D|nr:sporulation integral membrane protein YlbJ [Natroniella sulfidigena]MCK8818145.1 sporulation integral membrane protein YlbJ [Natroniella sulfidigena]
METELNKKIINLKALIAIFVTISLVIYSEQAFEAAVNGLHTWWEIVFPALLPFFIIAEILMGLGVVHFMGALLEPLMRPIFKVPGIGAFAVAMGLASGYPIGAKITGKLRREKLCTQVEGERLVSFANTADPLFMVGAVAIGMFGQPKLGIILALAHYISCLMVGFILRFYNPKTNNQDVVQNQTTESNILKKAFNELYKARKNDGRPFGQLLGESIKESVNTLLLIGGFIILFSVLTEILTAIGITSIITSLISLFLRPFGFEESLILPIISGLFEITNGSHLASQAIAPLEQQIIITSGIIAWSGLSVHAQVAAMVEGTDIRLKPYFFSRVLHGIFASLITFLLLKTLNINFETVVTNVTTVHREITLTIGYWERFSQMSFILILLLSSLILISLIIHIIKRITIISFHHFN